VKSKRQRFVWFDAREFQNKNDNVLLALQNTRLETLVVKPSQIADISTISTRVKLAVFVEKIDELGTIRPGDIVASEDPGILDAAAEEGRDSSLFVTIKDKKSLEMALKLASRFNHIVVKLQDETNIPLELIIAKLQKKKVCLLKAVHSVEEATIAFGVLEKGSDGVLLETNKIEEIFLLEKEIKGNELIDIELVQASVVKTKYVGMGHRACIDTTSLMTTKEGMLIGSTSAGGILVCSETHYLPYMNVRPFRVNAGAIHSYVWGPNNVTEYISDLKGGSEVLCVNINGTARVVTVGRVKIEVRPELLIQAEYSNVTINTIVQDDWHVRIFGGNGEPRNVTTLKPNDKVLARIADSRGRHVGIEVIEEIIEV